MKCVRIKAVCKTQKFGGYTDERSKKQKRMGITPDASGRHCVGRIYRDARTGYSWTWMAFLRSDVWPATAGYTDLGILVLTLGLSVNISIASIVGMILSIIIYRFL